MTENYKNECKNSAYKNRYGKIELSNGDTLLGSTNLSSITIKDTCINNNIINGNITNKTLTFKTTNYTKNLIDKTLTSKLGVTFDEYTNLITEKNANYIVTEDDLEIILENDGISAVEWLNVGDYTVVNEDIDKTSNSASYTAYDKLSKLDTKYECNINDLSTATVWDFYEDALAQCGLFPADTSFINSNLLVGGNPFTKNETNRTVISQCAAVGIYFIELDVESGLVKLKWFDNDITETFTKADYSTLIKNEVYGPVDCLVIKDTYTEGENVTRGTGTNEFVIADNYFLNTEEKRTQVIDALWTKIQGFTYVDYSLTSYTGRPYLKKGNKISIEDVDGNYFTSYILENTFDYDGTFKNTITAPALSENQTALKNTQSVTTKFRNVERSVDKVNGKIEDLIEEVDTDYAKKTFVTQTADEVTIGVSKTLKNYATTEAVNSATDSMKLYMADNYASITFQQEVEENGVKQVKTEKGFTFDNDGMTIDSNDSPTKSITDTDGIKVLDKTGSRDSELLFAGYDADSGTSVVRTENLAVRTYLIAPGSRFEKYKGGTGVFVTND